MPVLCDSTIRCQLVKELHHIMRRGYYENVDLLLSNPSVCN